MIFKQYGKVIFSSGLGGFFAHDLGGGDSRCATGDEDSPQAKKKMQPYRLLLRRIILNLYRLRKTLIFFHWMEM